MLAWGKEVGRKLRSRVLDEIIVFSLIFLLMAIGLSVLGEVAGLTSKRVEEWLTLAWSLQFFVFWWRARGWFRRKIYRVDINALVFQIVSIGITIFAVVKDNLGLAAVGAGLAVIGLIGSKAGVFIWTAALLPALKAIPAALSGYYVKKWLDERGKKKKAKPPVPIVPSKGKEQKDSQAAESETERELL